MARFSLFNLFRHNKTAPAPQIAESRPELNRPVVGAKRGADEQTMTAFDNSNITFSSELSETSYDDILRDKQTNINDLYQLADYYTDADPVVRGIIKGVYVPFAVSQWYLTCDNEKTIDIFEEHYKKIRLRQHIEDIFLQYFKYNNVFIYVWNGYIVTLPPHKCKIGNTMWNGTPVVDFNVQDLSTEFRQRMYSVNEQKNLKDNELDTVIAGYPPQIADAIKNNKQYAQMDPNNMFVFQGSKQGWTRYAIPWISSALSALAKKQLISSYQNSRLNIGSRPFVHVTYGDSTKGYDILPDRQQLTAVRSVFSSAMSGNPLAVTNHLAKATVVAADMKDLYQWPLYTQVNADILAAGGIAGIIVNGNSEDGSTFASAQVSLQAAASRINSARRQFQEFMNKVNNRLVQDIKLIHTNNTNNIPEFHFIPLDMAGDKSFRETCQELWTQGVISTKTLMETQGYSMAKQKARREEQAKNGSDQILIPRQNMYEQNTAQTDSTNTEESNNVGRPEMDDSQRNSDPANSKTSKQAKDAADGNIQNETS